MTKQKVIRWSETELNEAYRKVLGWFFSFPDKKIGLNDLSIAVRVSKTNAKKAVLALKDEGFISVEHIGRIWQISCNPGHSYNYTRRISRNLFLVYESGILDAVHKTLPNTKAVILFGSYRKGDDTEESDIDIAAEVVSDEPVRVVNLGILPEFGYRKNVPVSLHIFSRNNIDLNLFANVANGIVLQGFLEVRP
jgi:predicted nucleotidyltransferase